MQSNDTTETAAPITAMTYLLLIVAIGILGFSAYRGAIEPKPYREVGFFAVAAIGALIAYLQYQKISKAKKR